MKENNRLIANFMGWDESMSGHYPVDYNTPKGPYVGDKPLEMYHKSWDWLIPVVEKIENLEDYRFDITIRQETITILDKNNNKEIYCFFGEGESKLEIVYGAVIEFIQWYNKQNEEKMK